jgi:uncharacterized protein (DUF2147 family)
MKTPQFAPVFIFCMLFGFQSVQAQSESAILGTWFNAEKSAKIEILKSGSKYMGKIIWIELKGRDPKTILDSKNSDPALQKRPIMGLTILKNLSFKNGTWEGGKIYDPESGKTYSCELKLKNKEILEVKGYLGFSWVGKTVEWSKPN